MNRDGWLAALLVMLALTGCAHTRPITDNSEIRPEHGGGDGGGM
jgi:hypothetical protein